MKIARIFPRRTNATPDDELVWALAYDRKGKPIWDSALPPQLAMPEMDEVHVSVAFTWDLPIAERLAEAWRVAGVPVLCGGPAFNQPSGEYEPGLYIKHGYTITSRGCPKGCWFCTVPQREGNIRELEIHDGWNVLDNNILACSDAHVEAVFQMLDKQPQRALLTGGLEPSFLRPWHARRLREICAKRMYFAYDTADDLEPLVEAGKIMRQEGHRITSHALCSYVLIGYEGDTFERATKRLTDTVSAGFVPYAMLFRGEDGARDPAWGRFQREWLRPQIVGAKIARTLANTATADERSLQCHS